MTSTLENPSRLRRIANEFVRYAGIGGIAFLVDFGLLNLGLVLGLHYLAATALGFVGGLATAFVLCITWVWRGTRATTVKDFTVFAIIGVLGFGLTALGMWVGVGLLGFHPALTKIVVAGGVLVWNFSLRKLFVFFH